MSKFIAEHIAPCGINCATCLGYLRSKNTCVGCKIVGNKLNHCQVCSICNCENLLKTQTKLCFECEVFPCKRLKQLDKRYRTKYSTSLIGNLESIRELGMSAFLQKEEAKWHCTNCGGTICVHRGICLSCKN